MKLRLWLVAVLCGLALSVGLVVYAQQGGAMNHPRIVANEASRVDGVYQFRGNVRVALAGAERLTADVADVTENADGSLTLVLSGRVRVTLPPK